MTDSTRRLLLRRSLRIGGLALLLGRAQIAWGAGIVAVRVWPAAAYTRVTIESDAALQARHSLIESPDRLVIDIDGLELSPELRELAGKVRADDPYIAGLRIGQNQPRVVRMVFDLKQPSAPQVFTLEPIAAYQHRLVFDLYPTERPDPLLALVREKEDADKRAADAINDALGEFIDEIENPRAPTPPPSPVEPPVAAAPLPPITRGPPAPPTAAEKGRVNRLVIVAVDAGHGGEDPGAVGPTGLREKDVVLAVALRLRERLNAVPNFRVMLTREGDYFVPLAERVNRARRVQADLFVSIHADAFIRPQASGASVFALSERGATSTAARWMADRENAADLVGGVNIAAKDTTVLRTLLDMSTTAQIKDSLALGSEVLQHIGRVGKLHKREVEQAGFAVLKAPDIPSILVETAFISNPREEARLRDAAYREKLVDALATGIRRYFARNPPLARQRSL